MRFEPPVYSKYEENNWRNLTLKKPKLLKMFKIEEIEFRERERTRLRAAKILMKGKVTSQKATEVAEEAEDQHTS